MRKGYSMKTLVICNKESLLRNSFVQLIDKNKLNVNVVACASDGNQAFQLLLQTKPDYAVLDDSMDGMDIVSLVDHMQSKNLTTKFLCIADTSSHHHLSHKGCAVLSKPYNREQLDNWFALSL